MNIEPICQHCRIKPGATESFPFDENNLVFKVSGKIFAIVNITQTPAINLKCEPELALDLREQYTAVTPGYHMNKRLWNTVLLDNSIPITTLYEWINHSYLQVIQKLPLKQKKELGY